MTSSGEPRSLRGLERDDHAAGLIVGLLPDTR